MQSRKRLDFTRIGVLLEESHREQREEYLRIIDFGWCYIEAMYQFEEDLKYSSSFPVLEDGISSHNAGPWNVSFV